MSAADLTVRWGIWHVKLGRWLARDHDRGVSVILWWPTEQEAAAAAKQLNAGHEGGAAYVVGRLATL